MNYSTGREGGCKNIRENTRIDESLPLLPLFSLGLCVVCVPFSLSPHTKTSKGFSMKVISARFK